MQQPSVTKKLEWWAYQIVEEFRLYVQPFWYKALMWRTDGRTDWWTELPWHIRAIAYVLSLVKTVIGHSKLSQLCIGKFNDWMAAIVGLQPGNMQCLWIFIRRHVRRLQGWFLACCEQQDLWPSSCRQIGKLAIFNEQNKCKLYSKLVHILCSVYCYSFGHMYSDFAASLSLFFNMF